MLAKTCRRCGAEKPTTAFRADPRYRDGFASWCCECHRERNSAWAKENRQRLNAKAAAYRAANPELHQDANRRHKRTNKAVLAEKFAAWASANVGKRNASKAAHKAARKRATPPWADMAKIREVYELAARIQNETGTRMHVDHVIPLQHPQVCGLHVHTNLQILPGALNESKRNKWPYKQPRLFAEPVPKPKQEVLL